MNGLEKYLEAISNQCNLQEVGVVRPYPVEWASAPYPPWFKAPNLHAFDDKGSSNQYIYYFKSQIGNIVSNDAIMAHLFIGTLKGVAFEWFIKLRVGSIEKWSISRSFSWCYSSKTISKYPCKLSLLKAKERRVNQSVCGEILKYDALMSKWYDTVYTGKDLPPQSANHTPNTNRCNSKSHLESTSLTG